MDRNTKRNLFAGAGLVALLATYSTYPESTPEYTRDIVNYYHALTAEVEAQKSIAIARQNGSSITQTQRNLGYATAQRKILFNKPSIAKHYKQQKIADLFCALAAACGLAVSYYAGHFKRDI